MAKDQVLDIESKPSELNIGLSAKYRTEMSKDLSDILSATYQLVIKSHLYHWNVVGPLFKPLHDLTEEHYNALFAATDIIAERIRALGHLAPEGLASLKGFAPDAKTQSPKTAEDMIADLIKTHEAAVIKMRDVAGKAGDNKDPVTEDMLTARLTFHEKALWMLRATVTH